MLAAKASKPATAAAALITDLRGPAVQPFDVVLWPISHPELGEIRIADDLFAIGRAEPPFAAYDVRLVASLSRRHARIFVEDGVAYVADLESSNGTTVNGVAVREKPARLCNADELRLGATLAYRVQLVPRAHASRGAARLLSLTLTPVRADAGLQPIVLGQFPFLVGKSDATFARYQDRHPHEVGYLSRRHAHIFVKGATPFVEDLGSRNGTYVNGRRLAEHAVALEDGAVVGFGGNHFIYEVKIERCADEATLTKEDALPAGPAVDAANPERTTFMTAPASFLDIFCVEPPAPASAAENDEAPGAAAEAAPAPARSRGRCARLLAELATVFAGSERDAVQGLARWGAAAAAALAIFALTLHLWDASEREVKDLLARGEHAQAAAAASEYLARHPEAAEIRALGTEALLKGHVPKWLGLLQAGEFARASAELAAAKRLGAHNPDAQSLVSELEWIAALQEFVAARGGVDAPVRIYADEDALRRLVKRWNDDTPRHQRALATIAVYVPEFRDAYAEALSRLRKLQNDDSVYLAAIERLKAAIAAELERDTPAALEAVFRDYAEKYPRLGGLDALRSDLRRYLELDAEPRVRRLGRPIALLASARFATPPFQAKFRALSASDRFPPADVVRQYGAVAETWRQGDAKQAFALLQQMTQSTQTTQATMGPWADAAARELAHKRAIAGEYAALQRARGAAGYEERLTAFYASLDPYEDAYYVRATESDIALYRDEALARARVALERAEALWRQYRENGAIDGRQRLKEVVSTEFRSQAQALAEAHEHARRGARIYAQFRAAPPERLAKAQEAIAAEAALQRRALLDLRHVLEPGLLKAKLTLLGARSDGERSAS
jgi:pSer/pThr/pTyr-binding forkhead associated (FHA) protein